MIPAQYRKWLYLAYAAAVIVVTGTQVWFTSVPGDGGSAPTWTVRALGVLAYVGGATGLLAAVNTGPGSTPKPSPGAGLDVTEYEGRHERGETGESQLLLVLVVVVVVLLVLIVFGGLSIR